MNPTERKRTSRGRQKIDIKRIEKQEARQVCFSKRRHGLFKKANELCVLCGADVAIVVFSPTGKPFSYGHPSTDDVFRRFLTGAGPSNASPADAICADLNAKLMHWSNRLEAEKQRRSLLEATLRTPWPTDKPFWWDADVHSMSAEELREYEGVLLQHHAAITQVGLSVAPLQQHGWPSADSVPTGHELVSLVDPGPPVSQFGLSDCFLPLQQPASMMVPMQAYGGFGGFGYDFFS